MFRKGLVELVFMMISLIIIVLVFRYSLAPTINVEEQARIGHAKRLYGSAWKEALKLDDDN